MKKTITLISLLSFLLGTSLMGQKGFYGGFESGVNIFYGSISQKNNIGFTGGINGVYQFNNQFSGGLSYTFNALQGSRDKYGNNYEVESKLNAIDLHFYTDVIGVVRNTNLTSPVKANIDIGGGLIIYNGTAYLNGAIDQMHFNNPPAKGSSFKVHFGGEVVYRLSSQFTSYFSLLGNYCLTSEIDAYTHYPNGLVTVPSKNDFYYTTTVGARYYFGAGSGGSGRTATIINNAFGFSRFQGRKSSKESFFSNRNRSNAPSPESRFSGRQKKNKSTSSVSKADRKAREKRLKQNRKQQSGGGIFSFLKKKKYVPRR